MSTSSHSLAYLLARILLMALFLVSGLGKLGDLSGTQGYMEAMGVPGILLWPTIAFEIGSGLCILLGFQTRLVAVVLAGFSLVTAFIFHHNFADQTQQIMFLKNLGLAGGFLLLACTGGGTLQHRWAWAARMSARHAAITPGPWARRAAGAGCAMSAGSRENPPLRHRW